MDIKSSGTVMNTNQSSPGAAPSEPVPQTPAGVVGGPVLESVAQPTVVSSQPVSPGPGEPSVQPIPTSQITTPQPAPQADMPTAPQPSLPQETIVVPSGDVQNPFAPQVAGGVDNSVVTPGVVAPSGGGGKSIPGKILILLVLLVLIVGAVVAGKFALTFVQNSQQVTVTYWGLWESDDIIRPAIADFEAKNPKIKIEYVKQNQRQYRERLQAAIERGDGPDIFRFHNTWVPMLKNDLMPAPDTIMSASEFGSAFYPVASRDLVSGQTIFGLPLMIDGLGLYYNEDLFAAAGVTPPITYEELLTIVPKLTVKNGADIVTSAIALGTTGNIENFSDIVATMMLQNGTTLTNPTSVEAEQTLVFYRKFADPVDPMYTWNDKQDASVYAFANGRVAMIIAPSWRAFDIKQINPNLRFRIAPIPQLPGNTVTWASYWVEGVSAKTKYPKQAWEFVKYLTSRDAAAKLYSTAATVRGFGEPYALVEMGKTLESDAYVSAYISGASDAKSFPLASLTWDNGLNDKLVKYLEDAINSVAGGTAPSAALTTMASGFTQVLNSYGLSSSAPQSQ